jgi:hypothetical protein
VLLLHEIPCKAHGDVVFIFQVLVQEAPFVAMKNSWRTRNDSRSLQADDSYTELLTNRTMSPESAAEWCSGIAMEKGSTLAD